MLVAHTCYCNKSVDEYKQTITYAIMSSMIIYECLYQVIIKVLLILVSICMEAVETFMLTLQYGERAVYADRVTCSNLSFAENSSFIAPSSIIGSS